MSNNSTHSNESTSLPAFLAKGEVSRTVIGAESNFMGDISIREGQDLYIEGCVVGNVFHGGKVVVAECGMVIGSIFAAHLEIHGVVDAPDGEILAANLVVHGTSRVTASEVTVAAGCMNYERGGFMSAQMGMHSEAEVRTRISSLLQDELGRAQERRTAIEQTRSAARDLRAARASAAPAPMVEQAPVAEQTSQATSVAESGGTQTTIAAIPTRPAIALVPAISDPDFESIQAHAA